MTEPPSANAPGNARCVNGADHIEPDQTLSAARHPDGVVVEQGQEPGDILGALRAFDLTHERRERVDDLAGTADWRDRRHAEQPTDGLRCYIRSTIACANSEHLTSVAPSISRAKS